MSLNSIVASDRLRPLLGGVVDALKSANVSAKSDTGSSASLSISPAIKVSQDVPAAQSVRAIVNALITDGGGAAAGPIADTLTIDGLGLYFVGAGSSRNDDIAFTSNRTDADAPNLFIDAREGDDNVTVSSAPVPPPFAGGSPPPPSVTIDAGDGQDKVNVTASNIDQVSGGDGVDDISVRADLANLVDGGDGADGITVYAREIGAVTGGAGDDDIIAYGDLIGTVSGGDGNDQIVVGSRNISFASGEPEQRVPTISGGAGDDEIAIAGKAVVEFAKGDGNDSVIVGDTTIFKLNDFSASELQLTLNDDGSLTIAGGPGEDGAEADSITIASRTGTVQYLFDQTAGTLTVFTSDAAFTAANGKTPETLLEPLVSTSIDVGNGPQDTPAVVTVDEPMFLKLDGDVTVTPDTTVEDQGDGTLITFAENLRQLKLSSSTGPLFIDVMSNRTLALFKTQDQLDAWTQSPLNPANRNNNADPLMAVLERLSRGVA